MQMVKTNIASQGGQSGAAGVSFRSSHLHQPHKRQMTKMLSSFNDRGNIMPTAERLLLRALKFDIRISQCLHLQHRI